MTTSPNTSTPTEGQEPSNNIGTSSAESKETTAPDMPTKDTNTNEGASSTSSAQPSDNKKRRSNIQLNKDDHPEGNSDDDDGELNDEGTKRSDPFKRASEVSFYDVTCYFNLYYVLQYYMDWSLS